MHKVEFNPALVGINVVTTYLPSHSQPEEERYTFAYTITISNGGDVPVQLLSRHWMVGEQPIIGPGDSFRYTSGATLTTPVGCMEGSYYMVVREPMELDPADLPTFEVPIAAFSLHTPTALN